MVVAVAATVLAEVVVFLVVLTMLALMVLFSVLALNNLGDSSRRLRITRSLWWHTSL